MKTSLFLLPLLLLAGCNKFLMGINETGQVRHVVIVWLKPGADRAAVVQSCNDLRNIPGVVDVSIGDKLSSERSVVDSSYDLAMIVTLDNEAALRAYDQHPIHQKVVENVVKPNVAKFTVFDSLVTDYRVGRAIDEDLKARRYQAIERQREIIDRSH